MESRTFMKTSSKGKNIFWIIEVKKNVIFIKDFQEGSDKPKFHEVICEGKNIGKKNETTNEEQAVKEALSRIEKKKREYVEIKNGVKNSEAPTKEIKVMLFNKIEPKDTWVEKTEVFIQPKLDGKRGIAIFKDKKWKIFSRNWKEYMSLSLIKEELKGLPKDLIYDGEIVFGDGSDTFQQLQQIISINQKNQKEEEHDIHFRVFDLVLRDIIQTERLEILKDVFEGKKMDHIHMVPSKKAKNQNEIEKAFDYFTNKGFEGVMIRDPNSLYESKRTRRVLKMKFIQDAEFKVIDFTDDVGMVIWICKTKKGDIFNCVPKASDKERKELFKDGKKYIGNFLKVQFQQLTERGVPRFPVGLGFREKEDM